MGKIITGKLGRRAYTVFFIALLFLLWWVSELRVATDFPYLSRDALSLQFDFPRIWYIRGSEGLGQFSQFILWNWFLLLLSGFLAKIGIYYAYQTGIIYIVPIITLGIYGIYKILQNYGLSKQSIIVGIVFYLTTTYLLLLIDGGQLSIALTYSFFPIVYNFVSNSFGKSIRYMLFSSVLITIFAFFDPRFIFVLSILLFIKFVFDFIGGNIRRTALLINWLRGGAEILIVFTLLNIFWIYPNIIFDIPDNIYSYITSESGFQPTTWKHAVLLLQPHWYENVFGKITPVRYEFILLPILAFFTPLIYFLSGLLKSKLLVKNIKKEIFFWTAVSLVGIFLSKGSNPPFGNVYDFLFTKIPGFSLFRDATKFFFLISLSYSVLISFTAEFISEKFKHFIKLGKYSFRIVPLATVLYLIFLVNPVYTGRMTGMFSKPVNQNEYKYIWNIFENDKSFGRVLWLPSIPPLGYFSSLHPAVEGLKIIGSRPFAIGVVGNYEKLNFLREGVFTGQLLRIAGIKYIVYPFPDSRRTELKPDNVNYYQMFFDQLKDQPWTKRVISSSPVASFEIEGSKDHFFLADNTFYVVGSDRIYEELAKMDKFDLAKNAFIFGQEDRQNSKDYIKNEDIRIILFDSAKTDLATLLTSTDRFIYPSNDIPHEPSHAEGQAGWWKRKGSDLIWWRDFLQTKYGIDNLDFDYGGGWVIAEGEKELTIKSGKLNAGNFLLMRLMNSNRGGSISVYQRDSSGDLIPLSNVIPTNIKCTELRNIKLTGYKEIPDKITQYGCADFFWVVAGKIKENGEIIIKTQGDINAVNALISIPETEYKVLLTKIPENRILIWNDLSDDVKKDLFKADGLSGVTYRVINPTHYVVNVRGISHPKSLVFSETYDPRWQISDPDGNVCGSYKLYSMVNGFRIEKDGEYDIYFTPQKSVYYGLGVSIISFALVVVLIIYLKRKKSS